MKTVKNISAFLTFSITLLFISNASATVVHSFEDTWVNWPGITTGGLSYDENGTPKVQSIDVTVDNGWLKKVDIVLHESTNRQAFDSLFINTSWDGDESIGGTWDDWTHFVHDGESADYNEDNTDGTIPLDGLWEVKSNFKYTTVINANRIDNPNGIDADSLFNHDDSIFGDHQDYRITYDFGNGLDISGGFYVAYSPWCANDVAGGGYFRGTGGGGDPVPEPATMVLFGAGLLGLAGSRFRSRKSSDLK